METEHQEQTETSGSRIFKILLVVVLLLLVFGGVTLLLRRSQYQALAKETETLAIPTVGVIHPTTEAANEDLVLPGNMQAYTESPIYARTTGYLRKWHHDIGTRAQKGEAPAAIDTPEVDQELAQARAQLATSQANERLSEITAVRYQ